MIIRQAFCPVHDRAWTYPLLSQIGMLPPDNLYDEESLGIKHEADSLRIIMLIHAHMALIPSKNPPICARRPLKDAPFIRILPDSSGDALYDRGNMWDGDNRQSLNNQECNDSKDIAPQQQFIGLANIFD